jgi:hypothetical protein
VVSSVENAAIRVERKKHYFGGVQDPFLKRVRRKMCAAAQSLTQGLIRPFRTAVS